MGRVAPTRPTGDVAATGPAPRPDPLCRRSISCGAWVGFVRDNTLTIVLLAVMALGTAAFMVNYFAFCQDVAPRYTGLIVGILGGLGNLFAAGFSPIAGAVKDSTGNFTPIFLLVGFLPIVGLSRRSAGLARHADGSELDAFGPFCDHPAAFPTLSAFAENWWGRFQPYLRRWPMRPRRFPVALHSSWRAWR